MGIVFLVTWMDLLSLQPQHLSDNHQPCLLDPEETRQSHLQHSPQCNNQQDPIDPLHGADVV